MSGGRGRARGAGTPRRAQGPSGARVTVPRPVLAFLLRLTAGWVLLLVILTLVPAIERWAIHGTIGSLRVLLLPLQVRFVSSESLIQVGGVPLQIVSDCTPIMPMAALWAAVAAFPAPAPWKLAGLAVGGLAVWVYNVLRILALVVVLARRPAAFEFVHIYLWQTMTLIVVFAIFLLWIRLQRRDGFEPVPAGPTE